MPPHRYSILFVLGLLIAVAFQSMNSDGTVEFETVQTLAETQIDHQLVSGSFQGHSWLERHISSAQVNPSTLSPKKYSPKLADKSEVRTYQKGFGVWIEERTCPESPYIEEPVRSRMTSQYGRRVHPISGERHVHAGIDYRGRVGTPVYASSPGRVLSVRRKGAYGKTIILEHGNRYTTLYGHLSGYAVKEGQWVNLGQTVGYIGQTGRATGPHLHFEVRCHNVPVNPLAYLGKSGQLAEVKMRKRMRSIAQREPASTKMPEIKEEPKFDPNYYTRRINMRKLENLNQ